MFNWKPHPKQIEFFNDDRKRVLWSGGLPGKGFYSPLIKKIIDDIKKSKKRMDKDE